MRAFEPRIGVFAVILLAASTLPLQAQTLPAAESDLTVPPDLRGGSSAANMHPDNAPRRATASADRFRRAAEQVRGTEPPRSRPPKPTEHPVDIGLTMRGGSGTPRFTAATGTSQAVRESGSGFGAAMRFGF